MCFRHRTLYCKNWQHKKTVLPKWQACCAHMLQSKAAPWEQINLDYIIKLRARAVVRMHEPLKLQNGEFFLVNYSIRGDPICGIRGYRLRGEHTVAILSTQGNGSFYADAMYRILAGFVNSESECPLCCESTLDRENHLTYAVLTCNTHTLFFSITMISIMKCTHKKFVVILMPSKYIACHYLKHTYKMFRQLDKLK